MADLIPSARWLELPGDDHTPFTGDVDVVLDEITGFVEGLPAEPAEGVPLCALVAFRDVPSIGLLVSAAVRMRGRYVGDGVFAFDGLVRALSFALSSVAEDASRAGVHIGPCPVGWAAADIAAARIAQTVASHARSGAVRATEILEDVGVGLTFDIARAGKWVDTPGGPMEILDVR
jgi:hypothetical protein